jgi:hypothetical protein
MQYEELRLGNLVAALNDINTPAKICYINEDSLGYERLCDEEYFQGNSVLPIPLTEKLLIDLFELSVTKFEGYNRYDIGNDFCLEYNLTSNTFSFYIGQNHSVSLLYVHKLQNIYFELEKIELPYKT